MSGKLVIVESPAKARTINKILGKGYVVKSSVGHVRDLPVKSLGVDLKDSFKPKYVVSKTKKKIIDELKAAAKKCDKIYLAPDPDREGEAIAWHLKCILEKKKEKKEFFRVQYNEVTAGAVKKAFENPGELNMNRVNAQQARRILDRIVGYTVSPMLWRRIKRGLSAGRVQSVALRLVCERDEEIRSFIPEEYWIFGAKVRKLIEPLFPFEIALRRINNEKAEIKSSEDAARIRADLNGRSMQVMELATKQISKKASAPYITSTLQQAGSSYGGFSPSRTMGIAQKLYEGIDMDGDHIGLITYMRTDSFNISKDALDSCREMIKEKYGDDYCPEKPNYYKSRGSAQEAHEAIRPTDVLLTPEKLEGVLDKPELKLYKLIWTRFVASQMSPAKIEQLTAKIEAVAEDAQKDHYLFQASASEIKFPGYMKVAGQIARKKKDDESEEVDKLPPLVEGEKLECLEWLEEQKETQPPPHYSEASLIRALESNGVGRPSTFASIISTLGHRTYVEHDNKKLIATELGIKVSKLLTELLGELFDVTFTASMENSLDNIEKGDVGWTDMLGEFYAKFEKWMSNTALPPASKDAVKKLLVALEQVSEWAPEVQRGKRVYSDLKFVESITERVEDPKKEVSERQLETLVKIACHYKKQVEGVETIINEVGYEELLNSPEMQPPKESSKRKIELLRSINMEASPREFVESLATWMDGGRCLSEAQCRALNNIVMAQSKLIENFDSIKDGLELGDAEAEVDNESGPILAAMASISKWKEPVTRGKRVFNDQVFFQSLHDYHKGKGFLSVKQRGALKKIFLKYTEQIPGYEELVEKYDIKKKPRAKKA